MISLLRTAGLALLSGLLFFGTAWDASAQRLNQDPTMESRVAPTDAAARRAAFADRQSLFQRSLVAEVGAKNIGPSIMSGRVVDIDAHETDPSHFIVAYASGGLWITWNNGQSFEPLFDHEGVMTIGDIAVDWDSGTIWVGTGENNSSRSSYSGDGVYKSTDWGKTWSHVGLAGSHRTGRIIIHPKDANTVWVASLGALYSANPDRGVFKTTDGGASWSQTLSINDRTGAVDLVADPSNPDVLYAAMWERDRRAWNFVESGVGSGIHKSTDGGETWTKISGGDSGFPDGSGVGRIGLTVFPGDSNVLYASVDNQNRYGGDELEDAQNDVLTRNALREMSVRDFLRQDDDVIDGYLRAERFPERYSVSAVRRMVENGTIEPIALVDYVDDANAQLFNTPVTGLEVYRSNDAGATWTRTHEELLGGVYNTYGYYFGEIRVAPDDDKQVYAMGVPIIRSDDSGASWKSIGAAHVHSDHQALWMNPNRAGHIINGNDGGLNMSYDAGETWSKLNIPSVGQFYSIQVDEADSYNVYGGLQDNGVWMGPHTYQASYGWYGRGQYPYKGLGGGDGMQVQVDTRTNDIVYFGSQFGFYSRLNRSTGERMSIRPRHELGEKPLRFNWQTPILLSSHNQDIFYYGANRLYRSMNKGADLVAISPDLTHGGQPGDVPYGTLATIDESTFRFGLIYAGSDDGMIHVTKDGGVSWRRIDESLPQHLWVSRVEASNHVESRVYATLNGYRSDHFDSYVYRSDDFGATWSRIGTALPAEPVNVIVEDPANEDILYVGTDHAVYVSLDRGESFMGLSAAMPNSPVHDLKIQAREKHLLVGTHGRSIFLIDIQHVQQMNDELLVKNVHLFDIDSVNHSTNWGRKYASYSNANEPEVVFTVFAGREGSGSILIENEDGEAVQMFETSLSSGLNAISYDLSVAEGEPADNGLAYISAGTYTVRVQTRGANAKATLKIADRAANRRGEPDPAPGVQYEIKK
ncbi:MAG: glycosyl hydrolase [Bacteroidetes Order II. Incertae sedis bacterium]|jgi:photosystem II stability/assembly factor-like uncharacterized protein|nr:glycosyl hydrolase [Bacteroidetes Order II. bacterium]MBT4053261.1 glycosyl hydrolase [Bacteroidetes Order II. bacterium]MBT4602781.1 glycosyl hydrolase [Bacteroidetes Order II. bacterium]MBT5249752.1 glycosyl hydrolase [Bacteroidetes Order II. bacterium]MBT6201379.1 glycosyl hydrolase [Bacteroidetes Order II. bacterium]